MTSRWCWLGADSFEVDASVPLVQDRQFPVDPRSLDYVFGGGGRTTGHDPFLKARQHAEAATPEAPRTRRKIRHAQRGASFCKGMN